MNCFDNRRHGSETKEKKVSPSVEQSAEAARALSEMIPDLLKIAQHASKNPSAEVRSNSTIR